MKRTVALCVAAVFVLGLSACASSPAGRGGTAPSALARVDRPAWVLNPPQDDEKIFGMGAANSTNESRGWRMAENRARSSISYQITAFVDGMQEDYTMQSGIDGAETGENFFQDVGRQLTATVLSGARVEQRGIGGNGTYYVLVSYPESAVKDATGAAIQTAAKNARINKEAALRAMDKALAAKGTPELVEE